MKYERKTVPVTFAALLLVSIILILSGCSSSKSPTASPSSTPITLPTASPSSGNVLVTSTDGIVSLSVPSGWNTNDTSLYPGAIIGVANDANSEYVIVSQRAQYEIGTNSSVSDYLAVVKKVFSAILSNPVWGQTSSVTIGGCKGLAVQVSGTRTRDNANLVYFVNALANTKTNYYYNVCGWTVSNMADTNKTSIENIINSFKVTWPPKPTTP